MAGASTGKVSSSGRCGWWAGRSAAAWAGAGLAGEEDEQERGRAGVHQQLYERTRAKEEPWSRQEPTDQLAAFSTF